MQISVQNGQLPQGFCPPDLQTTLNGFSAVQFVNISSISGLIVSGTPPADHTSAWLQLDSTGSPVRIYFFAQGAWLSLHPIQPGMIMMYNQVLPNFNTFDGGDANALSTISGPMWQQAATLLDGTGTQVLAAQFPVGVGTFPTFGAVAVGANNVTAGGQNGQDAVQLATANLAAHSHLIANSDTVTGDPGGGASLTAANQLAVVSSLGALPPQNYSLAGTASQATRGLTGSQGSNAPHNNLVPFYAVYFLQRTNRKFYLVSP